MEGGPRAIRLDESNTRGKPNVECVTQSAVQFGSFDFTEPSLGVGVQVPFWDGQNVIAVDNAGFVEALSDSHRYF